MNNNLRLKCLIDMDALEHNIDEYKKIITKGTKMLGVVKSDAYGHGAYEVSRLLEEKGADYLAVAFTDEAVQLRKMGIKLPVLILGTTDKSFIEDVVKYDITPTVYTYDFAKALSDYCVKSGKTAKIHIKIDTGMSRIGFSYKNDDLEIEKIYKLPNIVTEGIFTHFAVADEEDTTHVKRQFERFCDICERLKNKGVEIPIRHCCNSAATIRFSEMHMDMVRIGISLYGHYPSDIKYDIDLKPVMTLVSTVTHIKNVEIGETISYGATYTVSEPKKIATVAIGYADGLPRILSDKIKFTVNGKKVPQVGRICMDQCMIDVTDVNNINTGDEVIIFGTGKNSVPIEELAKAVGTISYELLCNVSRRVPRCYVKNKEVYRIHNYLLDL